MILAMVAWCMGLQSFAHTWNQNFVGKEAMSVSASTWLVVADRKDAKAVWVRWWAMAPLESQFKVRKHDPSVTQRTDYHGAHYNMLARYGAKRNLLNCPEPLMWSKFKKTKDWLDFKIYLNENPSIGDMLAFQAFVDLVDRYGLDTATAGWKVDPEAFLKGAKISEGKKHGPFARSQRHAIEANWNGSEYLFQVKKQEAKLLKELSRASGNQTK